MAPGLNPQRNGLIYSATYSNVPVYEFNCEDNHVMRRQHDSWINATHILKVGHHDKPARTRILEREVQKGVHEKVQGGYGKYQGTWVPLDSGKTLAEKYGIFEKLRPIFDFVAGPVTPPPAPKHTTAASNKPKNPKAAPVRRHAKPVPVPTLRRLNDDNYDNISSQLNNDDTPDNSSMISESVFDEDEPVHVGHIAVSRKRKRAAEPADDWPRHDEDHRIYADALLDYFMLHDGEAPYMALNPPTPPEGFQVNRPIDTQGHTALHWAAAMGEIEIVKDLLRRGADVEARNIRGETPLIRAGLFANCFEKGSMPKMVHLLQDTITTPDSYNGTVFHHVAYTAHSCSKTQRARCYLDVLLNKLHERYSPAEISACLDAQDQRGDTAFHIAARYSKRCMRAFLGAGCSSDIPNGNHETVDHYLQQKAQSQKLNEPSFLSSSPVPAEASLPNNSGLEIKANTIFPFASDSFQAESARSFSESFNMLHEKAFDFVQAGEAEINEKTEALRDAARLLQNVNNDRNTVRQKTFELAESTEDVDLESLREDAENLTRDAEALEEQKQHKAIHLLVRGQEAKAAHHINGVSDGAEIQAKAQAAYQLHADQMLRRERTRELVRCQAEEGMSEKGAMYIKLLTSLLGVSEQTLPHVIAEVLDELEMSKSEGVCVRDVDGMSE